jgi:hypothetical protein
VIELVGTSASLYGAFGSGHVCLLVKSSEGTFSIDAKGSDAGLVASIVDEIKPYLA